MQPKKVQQIYLMHSLLAPQLTRINLTHFSLCRHLVKVTPKNNSPRAQPPFHALIVHILF